MQSPSEAQPPDVLVSDTENATHIPVSEAPPHKQAKFQRFRAYNTGLWNGPRRENKQEVHRQDDLQRFDAVASSMRLTDFQKQRARGIFDNLDANSVTAPGVGAAAVAWAVCVLVANEERGGHTRYWPGENGAEDEYFEDIAAELDLDKRRQHGLLQRVRAAGNF